MALPPAFSIASCAVFENLCAWMVTGPATGPLLSTLIRPPLLAQQAELNDLVQREFRTWSGREDLSDAVQTEDRVLDAEDIVEAALRQAAVQRHLAAFESAHQRRSGAGTLALVATSGSLAHARTHAAADTLLVFVRLLGGAQIGEIADCHFVFPRYNAEKLTFSF